MNAKAFSVIKTGKLSDGSLLGRPRAQMRYRYVPRSSPPHTRQECPSAGLTGHRTAAPRWRLQMLGGGSRAPCELDSCAGAAGVGSS